MKKYILTLFMAAASVTAANADILSLVSAASSTPATSGYSATVTVAATEVVEFHGSLGTGNSSAAITFTVGGKNFSHALYEMPGQHLSGPLTFRLFSSTTAFGGIIFYRIVPASNYAKLDASPTGQNKFMAAVKSERRLPAPMVLPAETVAR